MRTLRTCVLLALVLAGVAVPVSPAQAGGWAVTLLDPLPHRFETGRSYTVGYWVLQHGSHPYKGDLGVTGLRLVGPNGQQLTFEGVALREPAHYAAALAIPLDGEWQVHALQGVFREQTLGTLTVPGSLAVQPPDGPVQPDAHSHNGQASPWGAIHPPDAALGSSNGHAIAPPQAVAPPQAKAPPRAVENNVAAATEQSPATPTLWALLAFGSMIALIGLVLGVGVRRRRLKGPARTE